MFQKIFLHSELSVLLIIIIVQLFRNTEELDGSFIDSSRAFGNVQFW